MAISSEAPCERYDWWTGDRYLEVLSHQPGDINLSYARDGLPFCLDHDTTQQIGLLEDVTLGADGMLRGMLRAGNHPDAGWCMADIAAGIRKKVSVGYDPGDAYEVQPAADKGGLPTRVYKGWMPMEASSVAIPADYEVGVGRSAGNGGGAHERDQDPRHLTPTRGKERAMADKDIDTPDTGAGAAAAARAAEVERLSGLRHFAALQEVTPETLERWVADGTSVAQAMSDVTEAKRDASKAPLVFIRSPKGALDRNGDPKSEWDVPGEFFRAVYQAAQGGHRIDPRLMATRAVTGANEGIGADGGFAVPKQILNTIIEPVYTESTVLQRVNRLPVTGSGVKYPVIDETSRVDGSRYGGVTSAWAGEGAQGTNSKAKFRLQELDLKKLIALAPVTSEMLEDLPFIGTFIPRAFSQELKFKGESAVFQGTGQGQPLGIKNSGAFVSQAIEATQTIANSNQFIATNLTKMRSRFMGDYSRAVWWYNIELYPTLVLAKLDSSSGAVPLFIPAGGMANLQFDMILGRPAIPVEYADQPGTPGDLVLADMGLYDWAEKSVAPKIESSAHLRFDYDEEVFKLTWRVDGQPQARTAVTPYKGALTRSPFVGLATRS